MYCKKCEAAVRRGLRPEPDCPDCRRLAMGAATPEIPRIPGIPPHRLVRVDGEDRLHGHLVCAVCRRILLPDTARTVSGNVLCFTCYERLPVCAGCGMRLLESELYECDGSCFCETCYDRLDIDENEDMCESCRADKTSRAGSKHKDSSDAKQYISDYQDDNDYNPDDINADSDEDENEDELAEFEDENSGFSVIDREDLLNTDDTYTGPVLHNYDEDETEEEIFEEEEDEDDDFNYPTGSIPTDDLDDMDEEIDDDDDEDTRRK